jgi:putative membrane-bound dehydrogenase-like protein
VRCLLCLVGLVVVLGSFAALTNAEEPAGMLPTDSSGRALNFDFEDGTLRDWTATGDAFNGQPVKGDRVYARRKDMKSQHAGNYWVGTFEVGGDAPRGTLTSVPFKVTRPWAGFLVGGGAMSEERVEIVRAADKSVVFRASGTGTENMRRVAVDLSKEQGKEIFIRLIDDASGGWGHINFDDFKFYDVAPAAAAKEPSAEMLTPDSVKNAGLTPQQAVAEMTLPAGFKAQLVAGEPDVVQPVALAIDDRGRLWVAEALTYPQKAPQGKGQDKILIFEDTKGDGHFDKRTVFIEGLNLVSGLEVGFGGVWVGQAPQLLYIPILEGDKAGKPEVVLDGFGYQDTHETLNSFAWGPDGWLYGCHGVFTHSRVGKPGTADADRTPMNAAIWRYHPTKKEFEIYAEGGSNQWGFDWNEQGQMFMTCCVIPHLYHVIQGARYFRQGGQHFELYTFDDITTIADHVHWLGSNGPHAGNNKSDSAGGGHAHCGAMVYLGDNWPAEYHNRLFMNNIHGNRMNCDILEASGSGYIGHHGQDQLLMNDKWSRLIAEKYGPDGGVYLIDWYDQQACHLNQPEKFDRSNGRIYKITYGDVKGGKVDLAKLSNEELVKLHLHQNEWYVRHARRILQERGSDQATEAGLLAIALKDASAANRLRALCSLNAVGAFSGARVAGIAKSIEPLTKDADQYLRAEAIVLYREGIAAFAGRVQWLGSVAASDPSPHVRLRVAGALPRDLRAGASEAMGPAWDAFAALVSHAEDAKDHNLPLMYWYAIEPCIPTNVGRAAKLAGDCKVPLVREFIARRLALMADKPAAIAAIVGTLGGVDSDAARIDILKGITEGFAGKRSAPMPEGWQATYEKLAASSDAQVKQRSLALAVVFGDPRALAILRGIAADSNADTSKRQAALDSLLAAKDGQTLPILQQLVSDPKLRGAAIRGLAAYDDPKTADLLIGSYGSFDAASRLAALNTLASRIASAQALTSAIDGGRIAKADLTSPTVRNLSSLGDKGLDAWIAKNWGTVRATPAEKVTEIAKHKKLLTPQVVAAGDAAAGRALFAKTCMQCHTLFDVGAKIGPDLTGSNRANLDYVLENIIDPSAVIGKDYLMVNVKTKDGRFIDGIIKAETAEAITFATVNEVITLPKNEIASQKVSNVSMMPEGLLATFSEGQIRDLVKYLGSVAQVPMRADAENASLFFNGRDLTWWQADPTLWHVENGEMVGKTTTGIQHNNFAFSELELGDFRLVCKIKLVPNEANSGIQIRSIPWEGGEAKGYQADAGKGWWGKIYEESGRGLLTKEGGEQYLKPNDWNTYEILAVRDHVRLAINGHVCSEITDPAGAKRGQTALQIHAGGPTEVRFKDFQLEIDPKDEMKTLAAK